MKQPEKKTILTKASTSQHLPENVTIAEEKEFKTPEEQWQMDFLFEQFKKESDRAAVILVISIIDQTLYTLIKAKLTPTPTAKDPMFDEINSPFSTFSSKIDIAYRLGLISAKLCRDIHLLRKIRNSFAHDIFDCDFENVSVKSRITELKNSLGCSAKFEEFKDKQHFKGARGLFLFMTSAIIWRLNSGANNVKSIEEAPLEWIYNMHSKENDS